jgi:tetratricopeptide (TPR) repeat protein
VVVTAIQALVLHAATAGSGAVMVAPPEGPASAPDLAWVGEAVADLLPDALAFLGVPVVAYEDRLRAQESLEIPRVPLTRATGIRIAEAVGASRFVLGSYRIEETRLTLSLRLLDLERGALSAPFIVSGPLRQLAETVDSLAWDIALSGPSPSTRTREELRQRRPPLPFEALESYARGLAAGDVPARRRSLTRALALHPSFDAARLALGRLQLENRELEEAHRTLSGMPDGSPLSRTARFLAATALLEQGRYREAGTLLSRLADEDATPAVLNNQAIALLRAGATPPTASALLRRALTADPRATEIAFNLGWALLSEGDAAAAAFWLRGVVSEEPRNTHAQVLLAWALRRAGRVEEADREWKAVASLAPSYEGLAEPDLARRFERILGSERRLELDREAGGEDAEVVDSLVADAEELLAGGDHEGARNNLDRAVYLDPHDPRVHLLLARAHHAAGDMERALAELRMSLWSREDAAVRLELAELLWAAGRRAEARAEAEKVLVSDPANDGARRMLEPR